MSRDKSYTTEQESFWAGAFGDEYIGRNQGDYIGRNQGDSLLASNLNFFSKSLARVHNLRSCIEFGANIGLNIKALKLLYPDMNFRAAEINETAARHLGELIGQDNVYCGPILEFTPPARGSCTHKRCTDTYKP